MDEDNILLVRITDSSASAPNSTQYAFVSEMLDGDGQRICVGSWERREDSQHGSLRPESIINLSDFLYAPVWMASVYPE